MPIALPSGYVDTGITRTFECSCNVQLDWNFTFSPGQFCQIGDLPTLWKFQWAGTPGVQPPPVCFPARNGLTGTVRLDLTGPFVGTQTLETHALQCVEVDHRFSSATYPYTMRIGPLRLGVRLTVNTAPTPAPIFAKHLDYEYAWFVDGFSTRQEWCAGIPGGIKYWLAVGGWGTPQTTTLAPVAYDGGSLQWSVTLPNGGTSQIKITAMTVDGATVDTSELATSIQKGQGGGAVYFDGTGTDGASASSPLLLDESCRVLAFGGADLGAITTDADGNDRTTFWSVSRTRHSVSWSTTQAALSQTRVMAIKASWAAAHDPALPATDLQPLAYMAPPRYAPNTGYQPVTLTIATETDVQRPDGLQPSAWVGSGSVSVTEGSADTTFAVTATGATATRTLFADWEHRVGLFGTGDALFGIEAYERTKHQSGEDIWGWNAFAYLRVRVTAPKDTALTLTVRGKSIAVSDSHETSLVARKAAYVVTPTTWEKTYSFFAREGSNEVFLDLLFPNEAPRPFYPDRVTSLVLSGFQTGTYTLTGMHLVAKGPAYLKYLWGIQVSGGDYSALGCAQDGAFVFGNVPDQANKPDEIGTYGGSARYVQPLIGTGTGIIQDSQYTLQDFWAKFNLIEGWSASYSTTAFQAACQDPYGVSISEYAQFLRPLVPTVNVTPGTPYKPFCGPVVGRVKFPLGLRFSVRFHLHLYGGLEALAVTPEGERVGADALINAVRTDTGATVAQGYTDKYGYVVVTPVPANGVRLYGLQADEEPLPVEASVALRPRDLVRLPVKVNIAESGPWPLEVRTGQYHRTHARSGRVHYRRANHVLPPFVVASTPSEGLQPRCCRDYRGRVRLFYTEEPLPVGGVVQRVSDDDGVTFGAPSVVLPGGAFPSVSYDQRTQTVFATLYGGGALYGWRERPAVGGSPFLLRTDTGAAFSVEEDVAHACPAPGAPGRWLLACRVLGEGALSLWESTDDGLTWLRRATGLTGYTHPHVLADHSTGMVLLAGYSESQLAGTLLYPGETSFRAPHLFRGAGGAPLDVADVTFGIAVAHEPSSRWVLAARIRGESAISEFWSADWSKSWTLAPQ